MHSLAPITEPVLVVRRNTPKFISHNAQDGELWIVDFRAGFTRLLDESPHVSAHVSKQASMPELHALLEQRKFLDVAVVQADSLNSSKGNLTYVVSFVAGWSRQIDFDPDNMARIVVQVVRDWHFENERIARDVRENRPRENPRDCDSVAKGG